jgi:two-component system LytT family sensor kinase
VTIRHLLAFYDQHPWLRGAAHLLLWALLWVSTEDPDFETPVLARLLELGYAMSSFYLLFYGPVPRWWARRRYAGPLAVGLGLLLSSSVALYWQIRLTNPHATYYLPSFEAYGVLALFASPRYFFYAVFGGLLYNLAAPGVLKTAKTLYQRQLARQRLEQVARRQQLDALLGQVSPHFLFNTLNNLYGLLLHDDARARPVAHRLAALVRYCDELAGQPRVALGTEIGFIEDFLALARLRYGSQVRIRSEWAVGEGATSQLPPLLLLPLVENACKHGLSQAFGAAWVQLSARAAAHELVFTVANSCAAAAPTAAPSPGGLGLRTLRERLALLYPGTTPLTIHVSAGEFVATLRLPLHPGQGTAVSPSPVAQPVAQQAV